MRELKNLAERALILSGGRKIERQHLQLTQRASQAPACAQSDLETLNLDEVKAQLIDRALRLCRGNVTQAAKRLGVHRSWLYRQKAGEPASRFADATDEPVKRA